MARRTQEQRDEVAAFVNKLAAVSGAETNVDFANAVGLWESNVSEYRSGKAVPDGYNLIVMLRGVLGDELAVIDAAADLLERPALPARRRELEESVGDLLDWQTVAIEDLADLGRRLAQLESERASQRAAPKRRRTS